MEILNISGSGNIESDVIYVIPLSLSYHILFGIKRGDSPNSIYSEPGTVFVMLVNTPFSLPIIWWGINRRR